MATQKRTIGKLPGCSKQFPRDVGKERPCLNYHIKQCLAPCQGYVSKDEYRAQVNQALEFLNGNYGILLKDLESKMKAASEAMDFEEAIRYRDLYNSVKQVSQKQKITDSDGEDKDIIALAKDEEDAVVYTVVPQYPRRTGSRTCLEYPTPQRLKYHGSMVPRLWNQPTLKSVVP